ncbi:MAG: hypothetical protein IAF58_03670 [Leptolyngbya sp.]|nr:hypothetical protein [Candidatus Melainabacteria bacterium]
MQIHKHLIALVIIVLASGCAESKELTRSRALTLLKNSKDFKEPATIRLINQKDIPVKAQAEDDPEPEAHARAIELFYIDHPTMAVLQHLGLIEVKAALVKRPVKVETPIMFAKPMTRIDPWQFSVTASLTEKGRELNRDAGSTYKEDQSIALYQKDVVEVTGITNSGENQAQANFNWRAIPTLVGEAFDTNSKTYKNLPPNIQELVSGPRGLYQLSPLTNTLGKGYGEKKSTASFQRYDDGWRLAGIR